MFRFTRYATGVPRLASASARSHSNRFIRYETGASAYPSTRSYCTRFTHYATGFLRLASSSTRSHSNRFIRYGTGASASSPARSYCTRFTRYATGVRLASSSTRSHSNRYIRYGTGASPYPSARSYCTRPENLEVKTLVEKVLKLQEEASPKIHVMYQKAVEQKRFIIRIKESHYYVAFAMLAAFVGFAKLIGLEGRLKKTMAQLKMTERAKEKDGE